MTKFIHDNKQYLLDERQKYGKTKIDRFIDEYLKKEAFFQNKKALEQNIIYGGFTANPADILSINNANNIIMNYHLMNNAFMTGAISLMNYFPVDNSYYNNSQPQNLQPFYQVDPATMNGFPEGEKKEEQKSIDSIESAASKEENNKIMNDNAPKDPRLKNKN